MNNYKEIYLIDEGNAYHFSERECKAFAERFNAMAIEDGIVYVPVCGAIGTGFWDFNDTDYQSIASNIASAVNDDSVKAVVLVMDTPGGAVTGCFDTASFIKSCTKPVYAYVYGSACSAGFALASACKAIYMAEDANTGCCGVYARCGEITPEKKKELGFIERIFRSKNAPKKNLSPVSDESAAKATQEEVDALGERYLDLVSSNRGVDKATAETTFGQGAVVSAQYAVENHMADKVCSIEEAIADIKSSLESEGDNMDISKMSAEEQTALFSQLCEANPSFMENAIASRKEAEAKRIDALNALKDGSTEVDAVVASAIADGKTADSIMSDVIAAMKASKENAVAKAKEDAINALAQATTTVVTPQAKSEDEIFDEFFGKENK